MRALFTALLGLAAPASATVSVSTVLPVTSPVMADDFTTVMDARLVNARAGSTWEFGPGGVLLSYPAGRSAQPAFPLAGALNAGVGVWTQRTNSLYPSTAPATQTRTLSSGVYWAWITGSGSVTLSGAATGVVTAASPLAFTLASSSSVTFTVSGAVTFEQVERCGAAGAACGPTPPIVSTTGSQVRNADAISAPLAALGIPATGGSLYVKVYLPAASSGAVNQHLISISDGTATNQINAYFNASSGKLSVSQTIGGVALFTSNSLTTLALGASHTLALSWDATGYSWSFDGQGAVRVESPMSLPFTTLYVGSNGAGLIQLAGYVQTLRTYRARLADPQLDALTAIPVTLAASLILNESQGQSLDVGARGFPIVNTTAPYPTCALMPNDVYGTRGSGALASTATTITNLIGAYEQDGPAPQLTLGTMGETHLTAEMAQLCAWSTARTYVGRSSGASGKTIADLSKGGVPYASGLADVTRIANLARQNGSTVTIEGVSFVHGETDRTNALDPATYNAGVNQLVSDTNADWRAATGQVQPIRYGVMQLSPSSSGAASPIVQAQYDLALGATANPLIDLIAPRYMFPANALYPTPPGDGLHMTSAGYVWMGEYIAKWRRRVFVQGLAWRPLYPTAITFASDRQHITIALNVPTPPVVIDATTLAQGAATNAGLAFTDACGTVSIASVAVASTTSLTATLTAPSTCGHPMLSAAYSGPGIASNASYGAWTNIRDSDPTVSRSGNTLFNWLVSFSLPVGG